MSKYNYDAIPGLQIPKSVQAQSEQIDAVIDRCAELLPDLVERLQFNLENDRESYVKKNMEEILPMLKDVYARFLESEGENIFVAMEKFKIIPKTIIPFMRELHSLSIEIQKAQKMGATKTTSVSKVEFHAEMINNLSSVIKLLDTGRPALAKRMVEDIREQDPEDMVTLLNFIDEGELAKASALAARIKERHSQAINQLADGSSKKILAVDDSPEILSFMSKVFKDHYKTFCVMSGKAALKVMEAQTPDIFILDIDMPEMNGYELAKEIRKNSKHTKTPIIFLTGNSTKTHVMKALQSGGNDFIVKPASYETVLSKIIKWLNEA